MSLSHCAALSSYLDEWIDLATSALTTDLAARLEALRDRADELLQRDPRHAERHDTIPAPPNDADDFEPSRGDLVIVEGP